MEESNLKLCPTCKGNGVIEITQPNNTEGREWINVDDYKPKGFWNFNHKHLSEEVLIVNSCSINIGYWNRNDERWYVDEPARENRIDDIRYWKPLPESPFNIPK